MTSGTASVVTAERYASGIPGFKEWMAAIGQRQAEHQRHYDEYTPNADDVAAVKRLVDQYGVKALILGEDWCPDVWRGLPTMCKIAEATGMETRIFKRDENKDIMAEFLNQGQFESIPTIVFYDRDHNYICHWIERAKVATEGLAELRNRIFPKEMPQRDTPEWTELMDRHREESIAVAQPWREAQLTEIRAMLEEALAGR